MMYPYMTFNDDTEVTYSGIRKDGTVQVYIETPIEGGFKNLACLLPGYKYVNHGYDAEELKYWDEFIKTNSHIIMELSENEAS